MEINELRPGNLIKVYPRANQEGLLCVKNIQSITVICEMISPRKGYQFRIKPGEMFPIALTAEWLLKSGFLYYNEGNEERWTDSKALISFYLTGSQGWFDSAGATLVKYVHELQNEYHRITGKDLPVSEGL